MALTSPMMLCPSPCSATSSSSPPALFGDSWKVAGLLWARGLFGFGAIAFAFLSLEYIPIADSITLLMMSPFYAALLSCLFLGEPWLCVEYVGAALSMSGVVLVARPPALSRLLHEGGDISPEDRHQLHFGLFCASMAGLCAGCAYCFIRVLGTSAKMPWPNIAFVQGLVQVLFSPPSMYLAGQRLSFDLSGRVWGMILGAALIGSCSQFSMTVGMQHEKSARATLMRMSDMLGGFLWQALFTRDALSPYTVTGALLIALGVLVVVVFKSKGHEAEGGGGSAISDLMKKVEMQVVAASSRSQMLEQRYSKLQRDEDLAEDEELVAGGGGDELELEDDLGELCMTDGELSFLESLEKGEM